MKKIALVVTGIVLSLTLYGCSGKDPAAEGGQPVFLQDMALDMSKEETQEERSAGGSQGEIMPGGVMGETWPEEAGMISGTPESSQPAVYEPAKDIRNRDPEEIKQYLAQYPDSLQELSEEECYVVLHGQEYSGREYLNSFMGNVQAEIPDELVVVQFTVEGDPILIYLNYNEEDIYSVEDASRDAWAGDGEKYFEKNYDSVWLSGEADTEGNHYLSLYALQEQDMIVEVFTAATEDPLMCGLPPAKSPVPDPSEPSQAQTESKLPLIEEKYSSIEDLKEP